MNINGLEVKNIVIRNKKDDDIIYIGEEEIINDTSYSIHINYKEDSKDKMFTIDIIEDMAYEIAQHRYPKQYTWSEEQIKSIMNEFI